MYVSNDDLNKHGMSQTDKSRAAVLGLEWTRLKD